MPAPFAGYLKSAFPEIANAVVISQGSLDFEYEGIKHKAAFLCIDSSFFGMFDVRIVEGSMDFMIPENLKIAITREKALQVFGNESPVGKRIYMDKDYYPIDCYEICAVVTGFPEQSNYPFDFLSGILTTFQTNNTATSWATGCVIIEVVPGIDMEMFEKKLNEYEIQQRHPIIKQIEKMTLTPLTAVHYKNL
jgi:hypothetical protein